MLRSNRDGDSSSPLHSQEGIGMSIDELAFEWMELENRTTDAERRSYTLPQTGNSYFLHPISFVKYIIDQVNMKSKTSMRKLLMESYRYQRVPTQHVDDYCFSRSLKYLCLDSEFRISQAEEPKPSNVVIFASKDDLRIHWSICGRNGRLYHVDRNCEKIVCSSLDAQNRLIHIIELSQFKLTVNPESVFAYYTSPYVRAELNELNADIEIEEADDSVGDD